MKRVVNIIFTALFSLCLFTMPLFTLMGPHSDVSFYENRALSPVPDLTLSDLMDGTYFNNIDAALSDHIAMRDKFMKLGTLTDFLVGRPVINSIVVDSDVLLDFHGYSHWNTDYIMDLATKIGENYKTLDEDIKSYGGYFCYLGVPLQSTYFASHYPAYMDSRLWHMEANSQAISKAFADNDIPFINMHEKYSSLGFPLQLYLKGDHHYSYQGAFLAYTELMNRVNDDTGYHLRILNVDDLIFKTLPNPCLGSSDRKLYGLWGNRDKLEIAELKKPIAFTRIDNGTQVDATLYKLPNDDKELISYSLYMGGDIGETLIETNRPELPNVLIFGDSFTNPLETLVWASFNETRCLDLRYYTEQTLREYISQYRPDIVISVRDESVYLTDEGNGAISK